jgi:hypothetical protein
VYSESEDTDEEDDEDTDSEDTISSSSTEGSDHTPPGPEVGWGGGDIFDGGDGGDGGDQGGQLQSIKFPPPGWEKWTDFKKLFRCDMDGLSITSDPRILKPILGKFTQVIIASYIGRAKSSTANTLLVAMFPFHIFVNEDFKSHIIQKLNKIRHITHIPVTNDQVLLYKSITMASPQFVRLLQRVGVKSVTMIGYAQKAPVK